jgi:hypothetical protein
MAPEPPEAGSATPRAEASIDALLDGVEAGGEAGARAATQLCERFPTARLVSLRRLLVAWRDLSPSAMSAIARAWRGRCP